MTTWLAGLEERARAALPAPVFEYVAQGSRESVSAAEATAAWAAVRFAPHVLRDVTVVDPSVSLLGRRLDLPVGRRADHAAAGGPPRRRAGRGARHRRGRWADGGLQQRRHPVRRDRPDRRAVVAAGLSARRPVRSPSRCSTERSRPGPRPSYSPSTRRSWPPSTSSTNRSGTRWILALLRVNFDAGYDERPGAEKATDLSRGGPRLARRAHRAAGGGQGRAASRRRATMRPGAVPGRSGCPTTAAGSWTAHATTAAALPGVRRAPSRGRPRCTSTAVIRSGLDVLAALALGADAVFLGRLPVWALVDGEDGVARLHADLLDETVEALRLAGCADRRRCPGPTS